MSVPPSTSPMNSVPSETPSTSTDGSVPGGGSCKVPRRVSPAAHALSKVRVRHQPCQVKSSIFVNNTVRPNTAVVGLSPVTSAT